MASLRDLELAQRFRLGRRMTRMTMLAGPILIFLGWRIDNADGRRFLIILGASLLLTVFPLYSRLCNRCPRCQRSFSDAPKYSAVHTDDTPGLPLFNAIAQCPFCELALDSARRYL